MDGLSTAKTFYFYAVASFIIIIYGIYLLFGKNALKIELNRLDIFLLLFIAYCFIRLLFTPYSSVDDTYFIWLIILTALYFILKKVIGFYDDGNFNLSTKILIIAFLSAGFLQSLYGLLQLYDISPGLTGNYFKVIGTFGNPDSFSGYLASIMPFAFGIYVLLSPKNLFDKFLKYFSLLTFLSCLLIIIPAYIRGSWLAVASGVIFILWYKYNIADKFKIYFNSKLKKIGIAALVIIFISLIIAGLYQLKPDSAFGRLFIWKITSNIIAENPLFGIGFNRYAVEYNNYQAEYFAEGNGSEYEKLVAGNVKQAHNEFIQIWAELGIIGLIIFGGVIFFALRRNKINNLSPPDINSDQVISQKEILILSAKGALISVLIFSLFSFPLHILPTFINFYFLLSIISLSFSSLKKIKFYLSTLAYKPAAAALIILVALFSLGLVPNYDAHKKWKDAYQVSLAGMHEHAETAYAEIFPQLKGNGKFLFNFGGMLILKGDFIKAKNYLEKAKEKFNDPNLFIAIGQSSEALHEYNKAEKYYIHASQMIPHKLYPKYLLAKLYYNTGECEKAKLIAEKIVNTEEKVKSIAVREIKREMEKIIIDTF